MEIVVLPEVTIVLLNHNSGYHRRIYTWPRLAKGGQPSFRVIRLAWIDEDGDGRLRRASKSRPPLQGAPCFGPDPGLPTHADNQSIVPGAHLFDKADPTLLHDEITLIGQRLHAAVDRG